jgi:hypothetical protein
VGTDIWLVIYSHEHGTDYTPCDSEEAAHAAILALAEEYFEEYDDENEYADTVRKGLDDRDVALVMRRWKDFTNEVEDIDIKELEFPWSLEPGEKVRWNNPEGPAYIFEVKSIIFEGKAGDVEAMVRIEHENGNLRTPVYTLQEPPESDEDEEEEDDA